MYGKFKKLRRIISLAICFVFVFAMLPMNAFADSTESEPSLSLSITPSGGEGGSSPGGEGGGSTSNSTSSSPSTVTVEGESVPVTVTTTTESGTDSTSTTTETSTPEGGAVTQSGATATYEQTVVETDNLNPDGSQTHSVKVDGKSTHVSEVTENVPELTVDVIIDGEINPDATASSQLHGTVSTDEVVQEGYQEISSTETSYEQREVSIDGTSSDIQITEGIYGDDENVLSETYIYHYEGSSYLPKADGSAGHYIDFNGEKNAYQRFLYGPEGDEYWYAATQRTMSVDQLNDNGTPDDPSDDFVERVLIDNVYCADETTSVPSEQLQALGIEQEDIYYRLANLEDSGYYPGGTETEDHLRFVMINGYMFSDPTEDDEPGNIAVNENSAELERIRAMMKEHTESLEDSEEKSLLSAIEWDKLTSSEAANATQMAIWRFGNQSGELYNASAIEYRNPDGGAARIDALYNYLISGTIAADAEENTASHIINEDKFIEDMSITIGEKVEGEAANSDDNNDNDVYYADLSFTLVVTPTENDDLVVSIVNADGDVVQKARIAGDDSNDDASFVKLLFGVNDKGKDTYTFENLKLSENVDINFDLTLEGTQQLEAGVYIYRPMNYTSSSGETYTDGDVAQTMITRVNNDPETLVDVSAKVSLKFDVDEAVKHVESEWHIRADYPMTVISDDDPPEEEPSPKDPPKDDYSPHTGQLPQTGQDWSGVLMLLISGISLLAFAHFISRKRFYY